MKVGGFLYLPPLLRPYPRCNGDSFFGFKPKQGNRSNTMPSLRFFSAVAAALLAIAPALAKPVGKDCDSEEPQKRVFDWTVTWDDYAPDGFSRKMLLVNGESPGPVLAVREGDIVEVNLYNESPQNTSLHFHGAFASTQQELVWTTI